MVLAMISMLTSKWKQTTKNHKLHINKTEKSAVFVYLHGGGRSIKYVSEEKTIYHKYYLLHQTQ